MRPAFAVAFLAVFALAGCGPSEVAFQATSLVAAEAPAGLNLNDEIGIRFNQELDGASLSLEAIRVTDEAGNRLPIRARAANDVLYVSPVDADGWPAQNRLAVEIPHPWLGRPIRSATGAPNAAPFRAEVASGRRFGSRGGALRLAYHSLPFSGGTDVTPEAEFLFEFDGPLDPESFEGAVLLEDLTRSESVSGVTAAAFSPRRLSVAPFAGHDFRPGTRYRLTIAATLQSQDSRRLGAPLSFVFMTTPSRSGQYTTTFAPQQLVDPSLKPDKGPLTPQLSVGPLPIGSGVVHGRAEPFCREPSRVQILIPGEKLPLYNVLIGALSLKVFSVEPASLRLSARLDYAAPSVQAHGLSRSFDQNWNFPASRPRDLLGPESEVRLLAPEDGTLILPFVKPFLYEPGPERRSLVLELANESGILNDSAGIEIRGENVDRASQPAQFLSARGDWFGDGERQSFIPALSLSVQGYRPVALQPWTNETFENPEYFRRQDDVIATRGFYGYEVEYRRFEPGVMDPSEDDPREEFKYTTDLSKLNGSRTIQARIVFQLRSADPVPRDAGLLRLSVPFREHDE